MPGMLLRVAALLRLPLRPPLLRRAVRPATLVTVPARVAGARVRGPGVAGTRVDGTGVYPAGVREPGVREPGIGQARVALLAGVAILPALRSAAGFVAPGLGALLVGAVFGAAATRGVCVTSLLRHPGPRHGRHCRPGGRGGSRLFPRVLVAHSFALLAPIRHQSCTGARHAPTR